MIDLAWTPSGEALIWNNKNTVDTTTERGPMAEKEKKEKQGVLAAWAARMTAMLLGKKEGDKAAEEMKARKNTKD